MSAQETGPAQQLSAAARLGRGAFAVNLKTLWFPSLQSFCKFGAVRGFSGKFTMFACWPLVMRREETLCYQESVPTLSRSLA